MQSHDEEGLDWRDGVPVSRRFDDPYFSLQGGAAETAHVFLDGNDLPARLCDGFHVAELGFGTGLNLCVLMRAWAATGRSGQIRFTSFEAHPLSLPEMERAHAAFPALAAETALLRRAWAGRDAAGGLDADLGSVRLCVIAGDAARRLPEWGGVADAWFLDGFAPAKNPALWSDAILHEVARHTAPGGSFATYTAAGHVRRALGAAGFAVARVPGFGRKRHMTTGRRIDGFDSAGIGA